MPQSTGPKTARGKARSSRNAVKHGLLASKWLTPEQKKDLATLITNLEAEYQPETATQHLMIERIAMGMTKLRRLHELESALHVKAQHDVAQLVSQGSRLFTGIAPALAMASAMPAPKNLMLLARYQTSLDRQISKAIGELIVLKGNAAAPVATKSVMSLDMPVDRLDRD
jgi:hypothetical protein